jgi:hypothetical protein
MKTLNLVFILTIISVKCISQEAKIIPSNEYSKYESVIFYKIDPLIKIGDTIINTEISTVLEFEKNYRDMRMPYNEKDKLLKYRRQYFTCMISEKKYLFINFINFGSRFIRKYCGEDFNSQLIFGFGENFETNTFRIIYNLEDGSMRIY